MDQSTKERTHALNPYEARGYGVTRCVALKEAMLKSPRKAALAFELFDYACVKWGADLGGDMKKHPLTHLAQFFFTDATSLQDFISLQIKGEQEILAGNEEYLSTLTPKYKGRYVWEGTIDAAKKRISSYQQDLEQIKTDMAKKKVAATYVPAKPTDVELGVGYVLSGVSSIRAFVPADADDAMQELLDAASLKIDEGLDILKEVARDLGDDLTSMERERDEEKERADEVTEEKEALPVDDIAELRLQGLGPIPYEAANLIDAQVMDAFGVLLSKGRPLDLLRTLEALADPTVAGEVDSIISFNELLK